MTAVPQIHTYREFWPHYLREHARPRTRTWHVSGTITAVALAAIGVASFSVGLVALSLLAGYGPAFASHFLIEKNRPATFRHPLWSFVSDLRMTALWFSGALDRELRQAGVDPA